MPTVSNVLKMPDLGQCGHRTTRWASCFVDETAFFSTLLEIQPSFARATASLRCPELGDIQRDEHG